MQKKKRRPDFLRIITLIICLMLIVYVWLFILAPKQLPSSLKTLIPSNRTNILVMGLDYSYDEKHNAAALSRTDSLMLVSVDPFSYKMNILSIPRDTLVDIPGYGMNKINSAFAYGKQDLAMKTVSRFLGVNIEKYVVLNPKGFANLVDSLGGIRIYVEKDMNYRDNWGHINIHLKKGLQKLNGKEAHDYIRFRHDAMADIGRVERQQKMLKRIMEKISSPMGMIRAPLVLSALKEAVETNISENEVMRIGNFIRMLNSKDISIETLPGKFSADAAAGYWLPDNDQKNAILSGMKIW